MNPVSLHSAPNTTTPNNTTTPAPNTSEAIAEPTFDYFAYGSCMCPVDLERSLGERMHPYVIGPATLNNYRLGFYRRSPKRNCGVLDIIPESGTSVTGVLYRLPRRCSEALDIREEIPQNGYRRESISVKCLNQIHQDVRTYVVVNKSAMEIAPNDWYFDVVLRGAVTCGLPEPYCWQLFHHMKHLQQQQFPLSA